MEIREETTHLDCIHKLFKKEDPQLSRNYPSILAYFKDNSYYRYDSLNPKDESSSKRKLLLFSEYELWSYLETIYCSGQAFKTYNEPGNKRAEKFAFFQRFNPSISNIFMMQDLTELDTMKAIKDVYLEKDLITDLSLISDILTYDEILWTLYSLTQKMGAYDSVPLEAELESHVQDYKEVIQAAEWDFLGVGNSEEYGKQDARLFEDIYWLIRKEGISMAQEVLFRKNRFVLAALMNSGLAYHDFSAFDCDRYDNVQEMRGVLVEEGLEFMAKVDEWDKSIEMREKRRLHGLKPLDFMLCKDFQEVSNERRSFYLEKEMNQINEFYQGVCGNKNWLYSWSNFFSLSEKSNIRYEKAFYGYMSSNLSALLPVSNEFSEVLWVYFRCFLNHEVLRRFLSLTYLYKENLLNFCLFDDNFLDFDSLTPFQIYEKIAKNLEDSNNSLISLEKLLEELSKNAKIRDFYHETQFLLIKTALMTRKTGDLRHWEEFFVHLLQLPSEKKEQNPEFTCYLALILRSMGYCNAESLEIIDEIVLEYIKFAQNFLSAEKVLRFFSYLHDDVLKVDEVSIYLLSLQESKDIGRIKKVLTELMPDLAPHILEKQFILSQQQYDPSFKIENSLKQEDTSLILSSLRWLFVDNTHIHKAIDLSLRLLRNFILQDKNTKAREVFSQYLQPFLRQTSEKALKFNEKPKSSKENEINLEKFGFALEIQCYYRWFLAEETFNKLSKGNSQENLRRSLKGLEIDACGKIHDVLNRSDIDKEKFLVINLENREIRRALETDSERRDSLLKVKSKIVERCVDFLIEIQEKSDKNIHETEILFDYLTNDDYNLRRFVSEEKFREFNLRITVLLFKTREFIAHWIDKTNEVMEFNPRYFV